MATLHALYIEVFPIAKEKEAKERSLILVNSQCFALKEELHKLKKDQSFSKESRVSQMSKIKSELAEVQKTSKHYKSAYEKYKSDNEASERTILAKEQEIKQLKEALEEVKKNQASSSKRKHGDENIFIERGKEMRNLSRTQTRDASFLLPKSVKILQKNPISMPLLKHIFLLKVKSQTQNLHRIPFLPFLTILLHLYHLLANPSLLQITYMRMRRRRMLQTFLY